MGSREGAHYMANRLPVNLRTAALAIQYFLLCQSLSLDLLQDLLDRGGDFVKIGHAIDLMQQALALL